ncbi:histone deacetylase [Candidatus Aerophobetes bacterium]|nr:histone deacetylase [Candidatus Aerophobetes bacterium]
MVYQRLASEGLITPDNLFLPAFPERRDLLLVHTPEYLRDLENLAFSPRTMFSEIPLTRKIVEGYKLFAGGTILAGQKALEKGMAIHLGGGFHHAFPSRGEGFCYINDVAVGIRRLKRDKLIEKALIVDCDLHQGNGTAFIFQEDRSVFTFSIHQENLYPVKEKSDLDIGLPDFTGDEEYLAKLRSTLLQIWRSFEPDIVYYLAGADPYEDDQLGQLKLTKAGLKKRDNWVISKCLEKKVPLVILLAGGYAFRVEDTVDIHCYTCRIATTLFGRPLP